MIIKPEELTARITVLGRDIPVTKKQYEHWECLRAFVRDRKKFEAAGRFPICILESSAATWLVCKKGCCRSTGRSFLEALAWIEYAASFTGEMEIIPLHERNNATGRKLARENILSVWAKAFNYGIELGQTLYCWTTKPIGMLPSIRVTMKEAPKPKMDCSKKLGDYKSKSTYPGEKPEKHSEYKMTVEYLPDGKIITNFGENQCIAPYYFVWNPADRAPRKQHTTMADAEAEAERLAGKHPGSEFHVLEFKGKVSVKPSCAVWERVKG